MCTEQTGGGGRKMTTSQIRQGQNSVQRRGVRTQYTTSDFRGGVANLVKNLKPSQGILDRAAFNKGRQSRGIGGFNRNSAVNRMAYGSGFRGIGMQPSRGVSRDGRFSVNKVGDIFYKAQSGRSYKANYQQLGMTHGRWRIGGAAKYQGIKLKSEDHARSVYKDFGRNFDTDPGRGRYYKTVQKSNPQARVALKDEAGARRATRNLRSAQQTAQGNSRIGNRRKGLRISQVGAQSNASKSGVNVPTG